MFLSKKQRAAFTPISDIVKNKMGSMQNSPFKKTISLHQHWQNIVGPIISQHSRILFIKNNQVTIGVSHPAWHSELTMMKDTLLNQINEHLKDNKITEIKFKTMS